MGHFERDLVRLDLVDRITGIEISPVCVAEAQAGAAAAGMQERIVYRCADAWEEIARSMAEDMIAAERHEATERAAALSMGIPTVGAR